MQYHPETDTLTDCWLRLDRTGMVVLDDHGEIRHTITREEYARLDADDRCCDWADRAEVTGECRDDGAVGWCVRLMRDWRLPRNAVYEMYCCTLPGWLLGYTPEGHLAEVEMARLAAEERREMARLAREENEIMDRDEAERRGEAVEYCDHDSIEAAARELGMPEDSETARLYYDRKIHRSEAVRRAAIIVRRHEDTDYDLLLASGMDRDTAREMIR